MAEPTEFAQFSKWFKEQFGYTPTKPVRGYTDYKLIQMYKIWLEMGKPVDKVSDNALQMATQIIQPSKPTQSSLEAITKAGLQTDFTDLPPNLTIRGQKVPVSWELLGSDLDAEGNEIEYYTPILPQTDYPDWLLEEIYNNIFSVNLFSEEISRVNRADVSKLTGLKESQIGNILKYQKLAPQLAGMGMPTDFLLPEGQLPSELNVWGMQRLRELAGKDPSIFEKLGYIQRKPQQADQNVVNLLASLPSRQHGGGNQFTNELDYQQAIKNQLQSQYDEIQAGIDRGDINPLYGDPAGQARMQVVGEYQNAQKRINELTSGGGGGLSGSDLERENDEAARESELQASKLVKWYENGVLKTGTKLPEPETAQQREWRRLVEASRRPQRVARI